MLWHALPSVGRITLDVINGMSVTKSVRGLAMGCVILDVVMGCGRNAIRYHPGAPQMSRIRMSDTHCERYA